MTAVRYICVCLLLLVALKGSSGSEHGNVETEDNEFAEFEDFDENTESNNQDAEMSQNCRELLSKSTSSLSNGIYKLKESTGKLYTTFCDMTINSGGWTLVASIHENNPNDTGRCSSGDKWSSELGPGIESSVGNWMDMTTFGTVGSATLADFKNPGYFDIKGRNLMIWLIPNNTSINMWSQAAYFKYRTTTNFLDNYNGNLYYLYNDYYPIVSNKYTAPSDNGPAIPVAFDSGSADQLLLHFAPNSQNDLLSGFIQLRVLNGEGSAFALCPGGKLKATAKHIEHSCLGSTGVNRDTRYCGDFASWTYSGYATHSDWSVDKTILESVFRLFHR